MKLLTQGDIESAILALSDALDDETHRYADLADEAAEAEADYKIKHARATVGYATSDGPKMTAAQIAARVELHAADELRRYKLADARRQATREALMSLRSRLDAMRTLSANVRAQT
jgi:hypothetical protein